MIVSACMERAEADVSVPDTTDRSEGTTRVLFRVDSETGKGKDVQLNFRHEDVRRRKFTSPNFGGSTLRGGIGRDLVDKDIRTRKNLIFST